MNESAGKLGMPTTVSPARIFRPGDPGFPTGDTQSTAQREQPVIRPQISSKTRQCVNCKTEFTRTSNRQQKCPTCAGKAKPPTKPAAPVVAAAIASLRTKASKPAAAADSAFDTQVGGDHYRQMAIQPVEFIAKNKLSFCAGNVVKYVCRHHVKGGAEDLDKAIHYLQLERETLYGKPSA